MRTMASEGFTWGEQIHETRLSDGSVLVAEVIDPLPFHHWLADGGSDDVIRHELGHATVGFANGTTIKEISIIAECDSRGHVIFGSHDPVAAVAPHADGRHGTSFDLMTVVMSGGNPQSHMASARATLARMEPYIRIMAPILAERKFLSGAEFYGYMRRIDHWLANGHAVRFRTKSPEGKETVHEKKGIRDRTEMLAAADLPTLKEPKNESAPLALPGHSLSLKR